MIYGETKIYHDGSHYVGIPHNPHPVSKKRPKPDEKIVVKAKKNAEKEKTLAEETDELKKIEFEETEDFGVFENKANETESEETKNEEGDREMTRKELFDNLYKKNVYVPRSERMRIIYETMRPYFKNDLEAELFIKENFERRARNLMMRRIRMTRKANLQDFNYFCTFTYSNKLHTEKSFKKKLRTAFRNFCFRHGWKYMGVWERSPEMK